LPNEDNSATADVPPPTDAPSTTPDEGPSVPTKQTKNTYYVRAGKNETYIIEFRGHQLTAHCREALAWNSGTDKLGGPMAEHECVYMLDKVGKHISEDLMARQDNELRYRPWADTKTEQTADILDITDDVLLGAPKHLHPAPKTSPEILEALRWIQNTLNDEEGITLYAGKDEETDTSRNNLMPELNGCQVTFVYETREENQDNSSTVTSHSRNQVNLGDLDPTSLTSHVISHYFLGFADPVTIVRVHTTDKTLSVNEAIGDRGWVPPSVIHTTDLLWELPSPYAERFVKALRHATTLCGGKASTF
jgi:hypothetical protein